MLLYIILALVLLAGLYNIKENFADQLNDLQVDEMQVDKLCIKDWCFSKTGPNLIFGKDKFKKVIFQTDGNLKIETGDLDYIGIHNDLNQKIDYMRNRALKTGDEYLVQNRKGDNCGNWARCFLAAGGDTKVPWWRKENDGSWARFVIEK
jgi:hypothetical protein